MTRETDVKAVFQESLVSFLQTEVDTSLQFATRALEASNPETAERNKKNALTGYDTILHFLGRADLTDDSRASIYQPLERLRELLTRLGAVCKVPEEKT